jgi:hypothetical protein
MISEAIALYVQAVAGIDDPGHQAKLRQALWINFLLVAEGDWLDGEERSRFRWRAL